MWYNRATEDLHACSIIKKRQLYVIGSAISATGVDFFLFWYLRSFAIYELL